MRQEWGKCRTDPGGQHRFEIGRSGYSVGNRGGPSGRLEHSVENSLQAVQNAIDMQVDVVEIDVRKTADGRLILMHDATIDRTTNGSGKVSELTLDSIRNCYLKAADSTLTDLRVPTLDEVFEISKDRIMLNIDKGYWIFDDVYALAEKAGTTRQIIMKGDQAADQVLESFGRYLDRVFYMPIVNLNKEGAEEAIADFQEKIRPVAYELLYKAIPCQTPLRVKNQLAGKSLIWYNTMWNGMSRAVMTTGRSMIPTGCTVT